MSRRTVLLQMARMGKYITPEPTPQAPKEEAAQAQKEGKKEETPKKKGK